MLLRRWIWMAVVCALLAPLTLVGCGGGGGGGGGGGTPTTVSLSGAYGYVALTRHASTGMVTSESGLLNADATGRLDRTAVTVIGGGTAFSVLDPVDASYSTGADRSIVVDGFTSIRLEGRVADDGSLAVLSSRAPSDPSVCVLVRRSASPSVAQLSGTWTLLSWRRVPIPNVLESVRGHASIDASGNVTMEALTYLFNLDGAINPNLVFFAPERFIVGSSGRIQSTFPPSTVGVRQGVLSADGNLIVLGGDFTADNLASMSILVRKNLVNASSALTGPYHGCGFSGDSGLFASAWGPASFDGVNNGSWTFQSNQNGSPVTDITIPVTYGVGSDGTTDFVWSGSAPNWSGGVGSGGRFAFLAGGFSPGSPPALMLFLR